MDISSDLPTGPEGAERSIASEPRTAATLSLEQERQALIETLDRAVAREKDYESIHGHYTQVLANAGFSVPEELQAVYEFHVVPAGKSRFEVVAISQRSGGVQERAWMDSLFHLHVNFPIPMPREGYLKSHAEERLRAIRSADFGNDPAFVATEGLYSGYFRFELRKDSLNRAVPVAIGVRAPVAGEIVQLDDLRVPGQWAELNPIGDALDFVDRRLASFHVSDHPPLETKISAKNSTPSTAFHASPSGTSSGLVIESLFDAGADQ